MIDVGRSRNLARELEGVRLLAGGSGEIDEHADERLSRLSDALGYSIAAESPVIAGPRARTIEVSVMAR